ncbi:MAG TPA: hypothetical protein VK817_02150 [Trebonia sp.]|nr:hypothetical protein [Trebonia sp.]
MAEFSLDEAQRGELRMAVRLAAGVPLTEVTPESFRCRRPAPCLAG